MRFIRAQQRSTLMMFVIWEYVVGYNADVEGHHDFPDAGGATNHVTIGFLESLAQC